ncbi:hypothetical protein BREVUG8_110270 [Brevundimonas sp. G8]|nr:hypothetical protein BREVUG8_110270 [Brevundimonas sp. G8]
MSCVDRSRSGWLNQPVLSGDRTADWGTAAKTCSVKIMDWFVVHDWTAGFEALNVVET